MYEDSILYTYRTTVSPEEYENKAASNPDATRKIAYYFRETGYELDNIGSLTNEIVLMYDFLNFTDGI